LQLVYRLRAACLKTPGSESWTMTRRADTLHALGVMEHTLRTVAYQHVLDVRALLREAGLKVGTPSRKDFPARVRELAAGDAVLTGLVEAWVRSPRSHSAPRSTGRTASEGLVTSARTSA